MTPAGPKASIMRIDAIVVPRGAEARAVERGWEGPAPRLLRVPAGRTAGPATASALDDGPRLETALVLGLCGALDPALQVSEPVVYADIVDSAQLLALDAEMSQTCAAALDCPLVRAANVDTVVGDVAAKSALRSSTGASVIDMEAAALARVLRQRGIHVAMVRIVSDSATNELPDLSGIYDADGALRPWPLLLAFARAPGRSMRFIADARASLAALRSAATRLAALVSEP